MKFVALTVIYNLFWQIFLFTLLFQLCRRIAIRLFGDNFCAVPFDRYCTGSLNDKYNVFLNTFDWCRRCPFYVLRIYADVPLLLFV